MLRLSKLTDYAVVVLVRLSHGDAVQTSPGVAAATGIPEPTVAKVLKALAAQGLVASQRGARGGYRLKRTLEDIPVASVISAIDGPIALAACVDGGGCGTENLCPVRGRWDPVNAAVRAALSAITLADMQRAASPPPRFMREPAHLPPGRPVSQSQAAPVHAAPLHAAPLHAAE